MKWAITADLQFCTQTRLSQLTESGITTRLQDQFDCFVWLCDTARDLGCEGLAALGDIFDSRTTIDVSVIDVASRSFQHAQSCFGPHVLIDVGNHDSYLRAPSINSTQALAGLANVIESPTVYPPFAVVPWIEDVDDYRKAVDEVAGRKDAKYLLSHVLLHGAVPTANSKGRPPEHLRPQRWTWVFLGDVHDPVRLESNIQYVGAPMQHHYGDAGGRRGFWTLDTDTDRVEFIENDQSPRFHVLTEVVTDGVREGDFVRAKTDDSEMAAAILSAAGKKTAWVEADMAYEEPVAPRLDVHARQSSREILERYVKHQEMDGIPGLVDTGLELLTEAGAS